MVSMFGRRQPETDAVAEAHRRLLATGATVATAESLTGGRLAALWTSVPGVSATFRGGVVAYASDVKISVLGVPESLVEAHGVVSAECARAMATGIRRLLRSDYALATTGVAGPDRQEDKPAGTVFVGLATPDDVRAAALELPGDRSAIQGQTCSRAVELLLGVLDAR